VGRELPRRRAARLNSRLSCRTWGFPSPRIRYAAHSACHSEAGASQATPVIALLVFALFPRYTSLSLAVKAVEAANDAAPLVSTRSCVAARHAIAEDATSADAQLAVYR
jgi:hypothetical protein